MPVIPCNTGRFAVRISDRFVGFDPERGSLRFYGRKPTLDDGPRAALLIVAMTEGALAPALAGEPVIVTQRGTVTRGKKTSDAMRFILFQSSDESDDVFDARAIAIAERLVEEIDVGEVVVELQVGGMRSRVLGVER